MNYIKTIQSTEAKAKKMVTDAEERSRQQIEKAEKNTTETLHKKEVELQEQQKSELAKQKTELKKIYLEIMEKGEKEKNKLKQLAEQNRPRAIKYVLDQFDSSKEN